MAFTTNNDINILQASDTLNVGAGLGNDKYIVPVGLLAPGQHIAITDTQGSNTLQLIGGLTITSSIIANNALQLTLSNGAVIDVFGADSFSYEVGGNPLAGIPGTVQNFSTFVTTSLGAPSVPVSGTVNGANNVGINANGTTTVPLPAHVIDLVEGSTATVTGTAAVDVFFFDATFAKTLTDNTQIPIAGFDLPHDSLQINTTTALGHVVLDSLNNVDGISVQANVITNSTLINFGSDANGDAITITLAGVVDTALVNIDVI